MKKSAFVFLTLAWLSLAQSNGTQESAKLKLSQLKIQSTVTGLLQYAASGDLNTVKLLIASGIGINQQDDINAATALHNAAALGHLDMVKWLVNNNANVDIKDNHGYTALDWAKYKENKKVVNYLKQQQKSYGISQKTVLDYSKVIENTWVKLPQSSFHDWKKADSQAQDIIKQWKLNSVTLPWTKLQLKKYIKHKMMPSRGARGLALTHVAMHDALVFSHEASKNKTALDMQLTVSMAAASVLAYLFPAEESAFKRIVHSMAAQLYSTEHDNLSDNAKKAMTIGQHIANRVIKYAENDGAQRGWNGTRLQWYGEGRWYGPGSWEPTPPYFYYPPEEPYAPTWKTWVLKNAKQYRPIPPPKYGSDAFNTALKEVIDVNKNLTTDQLKSAKFWVDGHGTITPAGHWNQIAIDTIVKNKNRKFNNLEIAQMFVNLNIAMADTYVAAWDSKYHYWSIRPITAAQKLWGIKLKPAILTPPFPSYVSGHAATSGAGSQIMAWFFPKQASEFIALGNQAAMSRLYGGIHYRFDNDQGLILGRKIADTTTSYFANKIKQSNNLNNNQ